MPKYVKKSFRLDNGPLVLKAYENPTRWNNGPLPLATKEQLLPLFTHMNSNRVVLSFHGSVLIWFDPEFEDEQPIAISPLYITINKKTILVYDLADLNLLWGMKSPKTLIFGS